MEVMLTKHRIRIIFDDDDILTKTQTKQGLQHSWVLLQPHFTTIADIISHLTHSFQLHLTCPRGIILTVDGYALPPFEPITILNDTDVICVKRKRSKLQGVGKAIEGAKTPIEDASQQPLPSGIKLLTYKEHGEVNGTHQSDTAANNDKGKKTMLPLQSSSGRDVASKKRKASSEIESLETKKQRQVTPRSAQKKRERSQVDSETKPEVVVKSTKKLKSATSESKEDHSESHDEKAAPSSQICDGAKKASRRARRKKLKRMSRKINREKEEMNKCEGQVPSKTVDGDLGPNKSEATNIKERQKVNEESNAGVDLVPVQIRPGHIRFTPSNKVKHAQQSEATNGGYIRSTDNNSWGSYSAKSNDWNARANKISKDTFEWNGILNKRKGQKWGTQKQSPTSWEASKGDNVPQQSGWEGTSYKLGGKKWDEEKHSSSSWVNSRDNISWGKDKQISSSWKNSIDCNAHSSSGASRKHGLGGPALDFEKLVPLTDLPKVGDVFAYRLLELSSSWCPELSSFRVGKVVKFEQESKKIVLVPDPIYPLNIKKKINRHDDDDDDVDPGYAPTSSMYDEDGTLEIQFSSLVDVRILKRIDTFSPSSSQTPTVNNTAVPSKTTNKADETQVDNVDGKKDVWEEISEALSAKKSQLSQDDCWKKKENFANRSWSNRGLRGSALGPTMAMLRPQNGL